MKVPIFDASIFLAIVVQHAVGLQPRNSNSIHPAGGGGLMIYVSQTMSSRVGTYIRLPSPLTPQHHSPPHSRHTLWGSA